MKRFLIICALLSAIMLMAQEIDPSPFINLRHSSRDNQGKVHLRFGALQEAGFSEYQLFSKTTGGWQENTLESLGQFEYEALVPYEFGQNLRYRLRAESSYMDESYAYLHPAYLSADSFPPALSDMAEIGTDATGDSMMVYIPALDFTDSYVAATDTKLYRAIGNSSGSFPTFVNLTTYNVYMATILNPEALTDSVAFAMIYSFNIAGLLSTGLYKVGMDESMLPSFTRLGNVQSQVSGGKLFLSCNISDLTNDPDFGAWPNATNSLMITDASLRVSLNIATMEPEFLLGDSGATGIVEFSQNSYQVSQNTLPTLEVTEYAPLISRVTLSYQDADGDFPLDAEIVMDMGDGSFVYSDMNPIYHPDGSITFEELAGNPENISFRVSDNLIDYVSAQIPVSNEDDVLPIVPQLRLSMPNPVRSASVTMNLSGLEKQPLQMKLYNMKGQELAKIAEYTPDKATDEYVWNLGSLPSLSSGIYFIKMQQGGRIHTSRIILMK